MSALALILKNSGFTVQGSDNSKNFYTEKVKQQGVKLFFGHKSNNVENADVVVYTDAIGATNPEFLRAKELGKQIYSRAQMLEIVSKEYENVIAISGSHGKTTSTGMIAEVFHRAGLEPTVHIGGKLNKFNSNCLLGKKKYFITEACEFKNNFFHLKPTLGVILNVEKEHMDFFKTYENVQASYQTFADNSSKLVKYEKVETKHPDTILYGAKGYNARKVRQEKDGKFSFVCYFDNEKLFKVKLNLIGKHNIYNALATISVCKHFGIKDKDIISALSSFKGIARRLEIKKYQPLIIHDYAHHPSEISATIEAIRTFRKKRIFVLFQPHTYSRTKALINEFDKCFDKADEIGILKTYSARESYDKTASAKALYKQLAKHKKNITYFDSFTSAYQHILDNFKANDTVLLLGAGNIDKLADKF